MPTHTTDHFIDGSRPRQLARTKPSRHASPLGARRFRLAVAVTMAAVAIVTTTPADAAGRVVHPGESIQGALDAARPGDTIRVAAGTYYESITIATDGVTLVGAGSDKTLIRPPAEANDPCAAEHSGVCIFGQFDEDFNLIRPVVGVRLSNLSVTGFAGVDQTGDPIGVGVFVLGGRDTTVDHVIAADNAVFGFTSIFSSGDRFLHDTAYNNGFAGFQIAGAHGAAPVAEGRGYRLQHVVAYANRFGILVHAASGGVVADADLYDNCLGAMFVGPDTANWEMKHAGVHNNNRLCDAVGGEPASSGGGVAILGADDITIRGNVVTANRPAAASALAGGIIVGSVSTPGGDRPSNDITVTRNEAEGNTPADIIWDGTGAGVSFTRNQCDTSTPGGLCS